MTDKSRSTPEADLAFLRSIVQGGGSSKGTLTLGVAYLAGGLFYGLQCLFHMGQIIGWIRWPELANLAVVVGVTIAFFTVLIWAIREDKKIGAAGPIVTRTLNAAFGGAGMTNLAVIVVFGFGAARDHDFALWLYYPAMIFALQAAAWYVAWNLRRKLWMLATAIGGWLTAISLGLLVRDVPTYMTVCTAALFLLFAAPGWIMVRNALRARTAGQGDD